MEILTWVGIIVGVLVLLVVMIKLLSRGNGGGGLKKAWDSCCAKLTGKDGKKKPWGV